MSSLRLIKCFSTSTLDDLREVNGSFTYHINSPTEVGNLGCIHSALHPRQLFAGTSGGSTSVLIYTHALATTWSGLFGRQMLYLITHNCTASLLGGRDNYVEWILRLVHIII